jgi:hypothetical protein
VGESNSGSEISELISNVDCTCGDFEGDNGLTLDGNGCC